MDVRASKLIRGMSVALCVAVLAGCPNPELKPLTPCITAGVVDNVSVNNIDKVDVLMIVDNSESMTQEQELLARELPKLVKSLTTGDKKPFDATPVQDFPPVKDLHLAVVTSDVGVLGADGVYDTPMPSPTTPRTGSILVNSPKCVYSAGKYMAMAGAGAYVNLGDDGVMRNAPPPGAAAKFTDPKGQMIDCGALPAANPFKYPSPERFLSIDTRTYPDTASLDTASTNFANTFRCLAQVGIGGCGFEEQMESGLKAITFRADNNEMACADPANPACAARNRNSLGITFFQQSQGHMALAKPASATTEPLNGGFLRDDSLLVVLVVSDEEDCSAKRGDVFDSVTDGGKAANVLCQREATKLENDPKANTALHPAQRYIDGLLQLRPNPNLLVYAAIVGIPIGLEAQRLYENPKAINYQGILDHPSMKYGEYTACDQSGNTNCSDDKKAIYPTTACSVTNNGVAYPGRRFVQIAQGLEAKKASGIVQSICQEDYGPALDAVIERIADALGAVCLPRALTADENKKVPCDVLETLPPASFGTGASSCKDLGKGRDPTPVRVVDGREVCRVAQVPQANQKAPASCNASTGENCGWYYDTASDEVLTKCKATPQRIAFTKGSEPVAGSDIRLECVERTQSVPGTATGVGLGSPCSQSGPGACQNAEHICDPKTNTCQITCQSNANCPQGYTCDKRLSEPICVNPTCNTE